MEGRAFPASHDASTRASAGAPATAPAGHAGPPLPGRTAVLQAMSMRGDADEKVSYLAFVAAPLALQFLGVFAGLAAALPAAFADPVSDSFLAVFYAVFLVFFLAGLVLMLWGTAKLIARRNRHFARDRLLRQGVMAMCRQAAPRAHAAGDAYAPQRLEALERMDNEAALDEHERAVPMHVVLYLLTLGIWNLYILYFLLTDWARHAQRQAVFSEQAAALLHYAGAPGVPIVPQGPRRSAVVSLLLVLFIPVLGWLLVMHWLYRDPEAHFDAQWRHEDALLPVLQRGAAAFAPRPAARPGMPMPHPAAAASPAGGPAATPAAPSPTPSPTPLPAPAPGSSPTAATPATVPGSPWTCPACGRLYRPSALRPLKVTCRACGASEVLR